MKTSMDNINKLTLLVICFFSFSWQNVSAQEEAWVDMGFKDSHGNTVYWSNYDIGRKQDGTCDILRDTQSKFTWSEIYDAIKGKDYVLANMRDYEQLIQNCDVSVKEVTVTYKPTATYCDMPSWIQGSWEIKRDNKLMRIFTISGYRFSVSNETRLFNGLRGNVKYKDGVLDVGGYELNVNHSNKTLTDACGDVYINTRRIDVARSKTVLVFKSRINGATVDFVIEPEIEEDMGVTSRPAYNQKMNVLRNVPINRFWIGSSTLSDRTKAYVAQLSEAGEECGAVEFLKTNRAKARPVKRGGIKPKTNVNQNTTKGAEPQNAPPRKDDISLHPIASAIDSTISVHPIINHLGQKMVARVDVQFTREGKVRDSYVLSYDSNRRLKSFELLRWNKPLVTAQRDGDKVTLYYNYMTCVFSFEGTSYIQSGVHFDKDSGVKNILRYTFYETPANKFSVLKGYKHEQYVLSDDKSRFIQAELNTEEMEFVYKDSTAFAYIVYRPVDGKAMRKVPIADRSVSFSNYVNDTNFNLNAMLLSFTWGYFNDLVLTEWLPCYGIKLISSMIVSRFKYIYDMNGNIIRVEEFRGDNTTPFATYNIYYME